MKTRNLLLSFLTVFLTIVYQFTKISSENHLRVAISSSPSMTTSVSEIPDQQMAIVVDHRHTDVHSIPDFWIEQAKRLTFHYAHTSHGSQILSGLTWLMQQDPKYNVTIIYGGDPQLPEFDDALRIYDGNGYGDDTYITPEMYWSTTDGINHTLSVAGTGLFDFSMWSWCGQQSDNSIETVNQYLNTLDDFENQYPNMRFIYMTGHTDGGSSTLTRNNQLVRDYVVSQNKVLFDFADIESYDPDGNFYPYTDDSCPWCETWCSVHPQYCVNLPSECAHSHPYNCKLKGQAFWWMMARLAGWNGVDSGGSPWEIYIPVVIR